jgi:hypothetical protein
MLMFKVQMIERKDQIRTSAQGIVRVEADRMENVVGNLNFFRGGSLVFAIACGTWSLAQVEGSHDEPGKSVAPPE